MKVFNTIVLLSIASSVLNGQVSKFEQRKPGVLADSLFKKYQQLDPHNPRFFSRMPMVKPDTSIKYRMPCFVPDSTIKYNMPIVTPDGIKDKDVDSIKQRLDDKRKYKK
ncbi:MAG: hypothetical protein RDU14_05420 [Melioribacteraceae bacterium]|nr:hypothetical protein [Melioribacteraceae bacterium]